MKEQINKILTDFGLDFEIEKTPLVALNNKGETLITPYFGLLNSKSGQVINTCKAGYAISQNREILEMVLKGTSKFGEQLSVVKAGSINEGRKVFIQLAIEGDSKVGDDLIKRFITITDSNDGSSALSIGIGDLQAHCTNQFYRFYKAGEAKFRHTATIDKKIQSIPELIELALDKSLKQMEVYNRLLEIPIPTGARKQMVYKVLELDSDKVLVPKQESLVDLLDKSIDTEIEMLGKNLFALFNGVTRYTTHHQSAPKRLNGKDESLITGTAYKKGMVAFNFCEALV